MWLLRYQKGGWQFQGCSWRMANMVEEVMDLVHCLHPSFCHIKRSENSKGSLLAEEFGDAV